LIPKFASEVPRTLANFGIGTLGYRFEAPRFYRQLMQAILWDRLPIAKTVNVKVIRLEQAPAGYKSFDAGVANKSTPCIKQNYSF
jgi:hypothetical protein